MEKQKVSLVINSPPQDIRCECCDRPMSQLKPFGKAGDPLVGDFDGAILVKTYRGMAPRKTKAELKEIRKKYGDEQYWLYVQLQDSVQSSWECRDCAILSEEEYFRKREEVMRELEFQLTPEILG